MNYFIKVSSDINDPTYKHLLQDPLLLAVYIDCTMRARKSNNETLGFLEGEFVISQTEYKKFGLKKMQHGILERRIKALAILGLVEKTGKETDNAHATVYRIVEGRLVSWKRETGSETGTEQVANRYRTGSEQVQTKNVESVEKEREEENKLSPPLAEPSINEEDILKLREEIERKFL